MNLKQELLDACQLLVNQRLQNIQETITSHQKALTTETKSSAGDKHETGRAMLQLEIEKAGKQLLTIQQMQSVLNKIDVLKTSKIICLGSIIETQNATYFLSVSVGKIVVCGNPYFAISTASPIGKQLLGKSENDSLFWNGTQINLKIVK